MYFLALAAETELKKFGQLVEDVGSLLTDDKYDLENHNDFDFINVTAKPYESVDLVSVAKSENSMMSKIVLALTSIGHELEFCYQEARDQFLDPLLFYGEALEEPIDEAEAMKCIARMLPIIQKATIFKHSYRVSCFLLFFFWKKVRELIKASKDKIIDDFRY